MRMRRKVIMLEFLGFWGLIKRIMMMMINFSSNNKPQQKN